jgi:hypothetical protein
MGCGEMSGQVDPRTLDKHVIREALAGYAVAAEYIERERIERLRRMTPEESWRIFLELLESGYALVGEEEALHIFDERQLMSLLRMRKVFDRAAQARGPV